jgi:hypothetical protein
MTGPRDAYDSPLSALRSHIEDLAIWITIWEARKEPGRARPPLRVRRGRRHRRDAPGPPPHQARLISEVQQADRATAARVDALLAGRARDQELPGASRPGDDKAGR